MKIGVISDTHGDISAWGKAVKYFDGAKYILHCGDILYHGVFNPILDSYDSRKLANLMNKQDIPIVIARGNCDSDVDQLALKFPISPLITETVLDDLNIIIHHGDKYKNEDLADNYKPGIIISGHTHVFSLEKYKNTIFLNPGSPSLPKNEEKIPTVAVIENNKVKIIDINNGNIISSMTIH